MADEFNLESDLFKAADKLRGNLEPSEYKHVALGSGLIDHIQKITVAAMQIADMKVCAHRS